MPNFKSLIFVSTLAAALTFGCANGQQAPDPIATDPAGSLATYDAVCSTIESKFYDPEFQGVDWASLCAENRALVAEDMPRADLASLLGDMLAALNTSHTAFYTPDHITYYLLYDVFNENANLKPHKARLFGDEVAFETIGVFSIEQDGSKFIESIVEGSPAALAGLKVGDELISVDGAAYQDITSFRGKAGQSVTVTYRRSAGSTPTDAEMTVEKLNPKTMFLNGMRESAKLIEVDGRNIGYVHIWSSASPDYADLLEYLLMAGPLSGADALVIDLRGKIGGGGMRYLEKLFPRGPKLSVKGRDFEAPAPAGFEDKVVWVIDDGVRSSTELLAFTIKNYGYGPMVGTRTAGAVTGGSPSITPDDSLLYTAVAILAADGVVLEGRGIEPDIEVPFPIPYAEGVDPQLEAAIEQALALIDPDSGD